MNTHIRLEVEKDYFSVENITREAFWNLYKPGCVEHLLVSNIRKHPDFIPELNYIIEVDGEIVGSIFYTHSKLIDKNGTETAVITFGPVSILPSLQRKGLGKALIKHTIDKAKKLGFVGIIIGGFPFHYKCYGFEGANFLTAIIIQEY